MKPLLFATVLVLESWLLAPLAQAQYSVVTSPFNSTSNGFFEQIGVGFGFRTRNFFFEQNSMPLATPPFGGFAPGAGADLGFSFGGNGSTGFINIAASQGSRTSMVSQAPSITLSNGVPGAFSDTSQSPFVVGVVPVVNDAPATPLAERLQRIKSGEQSTVPQSTAARRTDRTGDPWRDRLKASQDDNARPALSVAEIRRRK